MGRGGEDRLSGQEPYSGTGTLSPPPNFKINASESSIPEFSVLLNSQGSEYTRHLVSIC